jgi:hypothetical protein
LFLLVGSELQWHVDNACGVFRFNWTELLGGEERERQGEREREREALFNALILDDLGPGLALGVGGQARQGMAGQGRSAQLMEMSWKGQLRSTTNPGQWSVPSGSQHGGN